MKKGPTVKSVVCSSKADKKGNNRNQKVGPAGKKKKRKKKENKEREKKGKRKRKREERILCFESGIFTSF